MHPTAPAAPISTTTTAAVSFRPHANENADVSPDMKDLVVELAAGKIALCQLAGESLDLGLCLVEEVGEKTDGKELENS